MTFQAWRTINLTQFYNKFLVRFRSILQKVAKILRKCKKLRQTWATKLGNSNSKNRHSTESTTWVFEQNQAICLSSCCCCCCWCCCCCFCCNRCRRRVVVEVFEAVLAVVVVDMCSLLPTWMKVSSHRMLFVNYLNDPLGARSLNK